MLMRIILGLLVACVFMAAQAAIDPFEFPSEEARERYQKFIEEFRCPMCKNNNLAGTNSQVAMDLRRELQELVVSGASDDEIVEFMVSRYGDFVLYRPQAKGKTLVVWIVPAVILFAALGFAFSIVALRRRVKTDVASGEGLSADEQRQFDEIMALANKGDGKPSAGKKSKKSKKKQ